MSLNIHAGANPFRIRRVERMEEGEILNGYCHPPDITLNDSRTLIVQGPRGSGKSTVLRALTASPVGDHVIEAETGDNVVGTYMNLSFQWVASFHRGGVVSWSQGREDEGYTILAQALNLFIALNFVSTLRRLQQWMEKSGVVVGEEGELLEFQFTGLLMKEFFVGELPDFISYRQAIERLERLHSDLLHEVQKSHVTGKLSVPEDLRFSEFFVPISKTVDSVLRIGAVPDGILWVFAFDELDYLNEWGMKLFNTLIRSVRYPIAVKGACLPHGHKITETLHDGLPADVGQDFDYAALAADPKTEKTQLFCLELYKKRVAMNRHSELPEDPADWLMARSLRQRGLPSLLHEHGSESWPDSIAEELGRGKGARDAGVDDTAVKKFLPAAAFRVMKRHKSSKGPVQLPVYAGWKDVVSASDGNPRRFFRLLDRLFHAWSGANTAAPQIQGLDEKIQSATIVEVARNAIDKLIALPYNGREVMKITECIGDALRVRMHESESLILDSCSVEFALDQVRGEHRRPLETALNFGVLCPWEFDSQNGYPTGMHRYWLSYGIAPHFWLVLRKGQAIRLSKVLDGLDLTSRDAVSSVRQQTIFNLLEGD